MRLFLSSFRFGTHLDRLRELVGSTRRALVLGNAADSWGAAARSSALTSDLAPLRRLGFDATELDLRDYVGATDDLHRVLRDAGFVWVRGGNTFVLRAQLARSGGDEMLARLIADESLTYAGYSAGACVLTPSLHGLDAVDDPTEVQPVCGIEPIWDGLGLVSKAIVPHVGSDPASDALALRYRREGVPHWALTDDQAVVVDGGSTELLR